MQHGNHKSMHMFVLAKFVSLILPQYITMNKQITFTFYEYLEHPVIKKPVVRTDETIALPSYLSIYLLI